jgi:uncharacterized Tic20 family protein
VGTAAVDDERTAPSGGDKALAAVTHLSLFWGFLCGPLILLRWPGRRNPYERAHAGEAFDFQLTAYLGGLVLILIGLVGGAATSWSSIAQDAFFWVFFPIYFTWFIGAWALCVRATIRGARGKDAGYPPTLRVIRRLRWPKPASGSHG